MRNPSRYTWTLVIPALLLQFVGFLQFWLPVGGDRSNVDRGGVALVALLSIMGLQGSVESFDSPNLSCTFFNVLFVIYFLFCLF